MRKKSPSSPTCTWPPFPLLPCFSVFSFACPCLLSFRFTIFRIDLFVLSSSQSVTSPHRDESKKKKEDDFIVIPLQEGWGNSKQRRRNFLPGDDANDSHSEADDVEMTDAADPIKMEDAMEEEDILSSLPPIMRNRVPGLDRIADEQEKFRADVSARPNVASLNDYERVPVEKFGEGLLRGMGWVPGAPIGANATEVVQVVKFVKRPQGLGLGAQPKAFKEMVLPHLHVCF